jgi:hypothetical protein
VPSAIEIPFGIGAFATAVASPPDLDDCRDGSASGARTNRIDALYRFNNINPIYLDLHGSVFKMSIYN